MQLCASPLRSAPPHPACRPCPCLQVGSPHCFLCQRAQRLVVPQQLRGLPKVYPLEKKARRSVWRRRKATFWGACMSVSLG